MNYNQKKIYTAFMESVCKEFKCMPALPALKEGFRALCESEGSGVLPGDSQLFLYDQENFNTETPFDELTEEEVCSHLTCWHPMTLKKEAAEEMMQEAKACDGIDNQRVIVSEPDRCIVVRDYNSLANNGMHTYFVRGMKFEDEAAYKDYDERRLFGEYMGFGRDRDPMKNPKPPAGWADKYREERKNAKHQEMLDMLRAYAKYLGLGEDIPLSRVPLPPTEWKIEYYREKEMEKDRKFAYRHPSTSHFSTGASSALDDDDLDSRRRFGEYLGFGKDRDPRLNPKPPKGWRG